MLLPLPLQHTQLYSAKLKRLGYSLSRWKCKLTGRLERDGSPAFGWDRVDSLHSS